MPLSLAPNLLVITYFNYLSLFVFYFKFIFALLQSECYILQYLYNFIFNLRHNYHII